MAFPIDRTAALPTLILFERHWDETPRNLIGTLLPKLALEGYNTFAFESPSNWSSRKLFLNSIQDWNISQTLFQILKDI